MERFWEKVERAGPGDCWPWRAALNEKGYGRFYLNGKMRAAHRVAFELAVGPIPAGYEIDHVASRGCTRRDCCNPAHLEAVDHVTNLCRGDTFDIGSHQEAKSHCKHGHPLAGRNLYRRPDGKGRECRACRRAAAARHRAA